jgi:hypothetical protein
MSNVAYVFQGKYLNKTIALDIHHSIVRQFHPLFGKTTLDELAPHCASRLQFGP